MAAERSVWELLEGAVERLDKAAHEIRDLPLEPKSDHIRRIGTALSQVFETLPVIEIDGQLEVRPPRNGEILFYKIQVQYHLFALDPGLTPSAMKGPFENPEGAWNIAAAHARAAEDKGHPKVAIAILQWFASQVRSPEHEGKAHNEITRLQAKGDA